MRILCIAFLVAIVLLGCKEQDKDNQVAGNEDVQVYSEPYRLQYHFSPKANWMNDPNGLVYKDGIYHLFYQYHPDSTVWGPMHWGHATSEDLIFWEHRPIALYPDELGYIFSGSAVVDMQNTSGFGTEENPPMVAVFTYHNMEGERAGKMDFQTQGIAYSLDNGITWEKFEGNPVVKNEGFKDFRDPKVFWHEEGKKWVMVLVAGDHARFYESANLKEWNYTGSFGKDQGAHGGVWECPDLFKLAVDNSEEEKWVLLISMNPGAPNGGSGTQYFLGEFDGLTFHTEQKESRWLDLGRDNYAGVTYNNTPNGERILIGWMSNWDYAQTLPTSGWRSAMTLPRQLKLREINGVNELIQQPWSALDKITVHASQGDLIVPFGASEVISAPGLNQAEIKFRTSSRDFRMELVSAEKEILSLEMNREAGQITLDRSASGTIDFNEKFALPEQVLPFEYLPEGEVEFRIFMDTSSMEMFVDNGQYVMTSRFFSDHPLRQLKFLNTSEQELQITGLEINQIRPIWE